MRSVGYLATLRKHGDDLEGGGVAAERELDDPGALRILAVEVDADPPDAVARGELDRDELRQRLVVAREPYKRRVPQKNIRGPALVVVLRGEFVQRRPARPDA